MTYYLCDLREEQPENPHDIIFADPPWKYNDRREKRKDGVLPKFGFGAINQYDCMDTEEICTLPVQPLFADRAQLYMWATAPFLLDASDVMHAWGFPYSTIAHVWVKIIDSAWEEAQKQVWQMPLVPSDGNEVAEAFLDTMTFFGPGFYSASNAEFILLGWREKPFQHAKGRKARQVFFSPLQEHSRKPERPQDKIQWMYPGLRYCELFGRRDREGWDVYGNENIFPAYSCGT